jgi:predicted P-loop ATPase
MTLSSRPAKQTSSDKPDKPDKPRLVRYHELKGRFVELHGTPRLNVRTGGVEIGGQALSADEVGRFYLELSSPYEQWPIQPTADAIWAMAEANQFDPVANYLDGLAEHTPLPLEQWQRLDQLLLGIDNPTAATFLPQYFVGAVARVFDPGCEARCSPVLVGPQQRGKTTLGRILFGDPFWVEGLADLSRDSRMRCQTAWGIELSELDGITRRSDVESLKTYLTERDDSFRKPYGKGIVRTPRRFVFWGTSNHSPLRDLSGNSRFLCIGLPDQMLPLDWALTHRDALWARAVEQYRSGNDWRKVTEQQRQERIAANLDFQQIDPWGEILGPLLAWQTDGFITLGTIYEKLEVSPERQNSANARRIAQLVEAQGWEYGRRRRSGSNLRGFWKAETPMKEQGGEDDTPIDEIF